MKNEKGEIRTCNLVTLKAHSQFSVAVDNVRDSLQMYGHLQPKVAYTDNLADKVFLESGFPSLCEDIKPVDKYGHLEPLKIPPSVCIYILNKASLINDTLGTILDDLFETDNEQNIVVGFDSEWNVEMSGSGHITGRGGTGVV